MLPLIAKEMAFTVRDKGVSLQQRSSADESEHALNSVVLGTRANNVTPRSFSGIPEPSRTTSTTSTRISEPEKTFSLATEVGRRTDQRTGNDGVQDGTTHEHRCTLQTTPVRRVVSSVTVSMTLLWLRDRPSTRNLPRVRRSSRLYSRDHVRDNFDGTVEVGGGHAVRKLHHGDIVVFGRGRGGLRVNLGSCERSLTRGGRATLAQELRGEHTLVQGAAIARRPSSGGGGEKSRSRLSMSETFFDLGLSVLPDLRSVRAKGEPEADKVGLEE